VYSWGTSLSVITFEPRSEEEGHRYFPEFQTNERFKLVNLETGFVARSPIIHISVHGNVLYCSTLKDSLLTIAYDPTSHTFQTIMSDPKPRLSTYHLITEDEIFIADKEGSVVCLGGNSIPMGYFLMIGGPRHSSFKEFFHVYLGSPVCRLREGILEGPRIGDTDRERKLSIIAIGIDGSITLLKRCYLIRLYALRLIQWQLSRASELGMLLSWVLTIANYEMTMNYDWMNRIDRGISKNGMSLDTLASCVEQMSTGEKMVLKDTDFRQQNLGELNNIPGGKDDTIDWVCAAREILAEEFGGVSL